MGRKTGIQIIEDDGGVKKRALKDDSCPVCGAPKGKYKCERCGWGVEELGAEISTGLKDPVSTIMSARITFKGLKKENVELREKVERLIANNRKFSELVDAMESQMKTMRADAGKKYVYRYGVGGWGEIGEIDRTKLMLKKSVTVDDINRQLSEIVRLLAKYKK